MELLRLKHLAAWFTLIFLISGTDGFSHLVRMKEKMHKVIRGPYVRPGVKTPPEEWFTQKLDHFNPTDSRTWQQRFYTNDSFHSPGGPVFLMIGGEGPIGVGWMLYGYWIELAQQHGALCFQLEHRFYGNSRPTKDLSNENIAYLSSEQALADLAYFIEAMNRDRQLKGSKWIVFGGSYPGSLAAWMRMKYPHLVHGAVSSSGPINAKADFFEYMEVVAASMSYYTPSCQQHVAEATSQIEALLNSGGAKEISTKFRLCDVLDTSNQNNVANFFETLANNWAFIVQYNQWYYMSGEPEQSNLNIASACNVMNANDGQSALNHYSNLNSQIMGSAGEFCLNIDYQSLIDYIKYSEWMEEGSMYRQWFYQTCTEFGFYQTSNSTKQPFGSKFPLSLFTQECADVFGSNFNSKFLASAIDRTNTFYGGLGIDVSNVVFVHGSIDPWHALGLTHTVSDDAPAIYIEGTSHCADMMPSYSTDSSQLKAARVKIQSLVQQWLQ